MNILCFGDSNTYGISPLDGKRFDEHTRWPCLLADKLGAGHLVIEAGLPNRTIADEPPFSGDKLGVKYLEPYLRAYHIDVIIINKIIIYTIFFHSWFLFNSYFRFHLVSIIIYRRKAKY